MKFSVKHLEISSKRSNVEGINEQLAPKENVVSMDDLELDIPVEEVVKTSEIAGKEFFLGLIGWIQEESRNNRIDSDTRRIEAENERERLAQRREEKEAEAAANRQ